MCCAAWYDDDDIYGDDDDNYGDHGDERATEAAIFVVLCSLVC